MSDQLININVSHTVRQVNVEIIPATPQLIDITAIRGAEPLFLAWKNAAFLTGAKKTGVDAGVMPSFSFTDDYLYILVQEGTAGEAIWKKALLFQT